MNAIVKNLALIITGVIAGMWLSDNTTFLPRSIPTGRVVSGFLAPREVQLARIVDQIYSKQIDSLQSRNQQLTQEVQTNKSALKRQRQDDRMLRELIDTLVAHTLTATDTIQKLRDCDSLGNTVGQLLSADRKQDSLCDNTVQSLERVVSNRDSTIDMQRRAYATIRTSFENCIVQQDALQDQFKTIERANRRLVIKNKIVSTAVVVLTGIVTYNIVRH